MKQDEFNSKNTKKQIIIIASIVAISVAIIVIASALIYNYFFKDEIKKEEFNEQMTQTLNKDSSLAKEDVKKSDEVIKKHNLNICGQYVTTYNEITQESNDQSQGNTGVTTETVTLGMLINEDNTINFSDGKKGWWLVDETKEGAIHLAIGKEDAESVELLLLCDNGSMVDVGKAVFFGQIPAETTFEQEFTDASGNMVLQFKKDGTIDGEYNEIIEEDGQEFPWTEVYRGEYKKTGEYLDMVLNGSHARYLVFTAQTADPEKPVTGFASKYYTKQVAKA